MSERMYTDLWKAYRAGWIQAASEYGGPEYERTVAEAEAYACKYAEARATPTPARSEAAGGEEVWNVPGSALKHGSWEGFLDCLAGCKDIHESDAERLRAAAGEIRSLRQQLATAEQDREHWRITSDAHATVIEGALTIMGQSAGADLEAVATETVQQLAAAREDGERLDWIERCAHAIELRGAHEPQRIIADRATIDYVRSFDRARTEPAREGEGGGNGQ